MSMGTFWENRVLDKDYYASIVRAKVNSGSKLVCSLHRNFVLTGKPIASQEFSHLRVGVSESFKKRELGQHQSYKPCVICHRLTWNHYPAINEDGVEIEEYAHKNCLEKLAKGEI